MSTLLDISQETLNQEVTGIDEYICIIGVEVSELSDIGDNMFDRRLSDLMYLINIRNSLAFFSVESDFLTQDDLRYLINQAKKVINNIELPDNSIYQ